MYKCNKNYVSQYAFIDTNKCIHITEYNKNDHIKCRNGHDLICVNGTHFIHKNITDCGTQPMTEWHCEWQGNFPHTEVEYKKKENQIKTRRADVALENSIYNIEFQHSFIDLEEVRNRKADYELHGRKIIWVVHGRPKWICDSFIDYEYIFIDIDNMLYKIDPRQNIIVDEPIDKATFIEFIKSNTLYIKQQGAGNGKTFGLIQNIESKDFEHYKCFIIVTKQHSAKSVIYNELQNQIQNNQLKYITDLTFEYVNNKYQISYKNTNTNNTCHILIATIDSLMYSLGNPNNKELNKFEGIVTSIIDGYIEGHSIKMNGKSYKLNKDLCLFVDETQDLSEDYAKAIITIMRNKHIDSYIVGDRLQSIGLEKNAFEYFSNNEFSYIHKKQYEPTNICRRFYHTDLIEFVNSIIPFSKYSLPEIKQYRTDDEPDVKHLHIFQGDNDMNKEVEKILDFYNNEVIQNNYKPNDFLIVTPFTSNNPLVTALETAIQTYWVDKNHIYERYAVFHKSEQGSSINLQESENATRIVSIHTAKGDGRNVVFVIGITENGLKKFSHESNNLVYDSLIHVSLTRMKKTLYFRVMNNKDDISNKILKFNKPYIDIPTKIKYTDIISDEFKKDHFKLLLGKVINKPEEKVNIDTCYQYITMIIHLYIKIVSNQADKSNIKKQIKAIFIKITDTKILLTDNWQEYYTNITQNKLCLLKIMDNYEVILDFMKNIQRKLQCKILYRLCPLESIVMYYMIQITHQGIYSNISINELYNIIDIYSKTFNSSYRGHKNCLCKTHFDNNNGNCKMTKYLQKHYDTISNIGKIYDTFLEEYPNVNWLIDYFIKYNGSHDDFTIYNKFNLIGYDENNVFIVYVKPQFNDLNLLDSIYDTFLVKQSSDSKYENKKIITVIFSLDNKTYKLYDWQPNKKDIVEQLRSHLVKKYCSETNNVFKYYKWHRDEGVSLKDIKPTFLVRFFDNIKDVNMYDDKEYFLHKLNNVIIKSIDDYFDETA